MTETVCDRALAMDRSSIVFQDNTSNRKITSIDGVDDLESRSIAA
jgi:hypothetical protein